MKLGEVADRIEQFDEDLTIYAARPWTIDSEASLEVNEDSTTRPLNGLDYFLEVDIAVEVIEAWSIHRPGQVPTTAERCEAIVFYADNDCYLIPGGYDPIS
ncbi:hypothetical protein [Kribbella albertanoniae]|uniref:Uncharacterized protein n=1 Tax=Kribbella albertanoniae TaxID=1266829 RepID=A0A4R4Q1Q4_9ACTN|nr:hypothetical protein [Kribbella albertanoniae]TDC28854.1 hypothetical protein E1261_17415 [Kribbella albertanoniae]